MMAYGVRLFFFFNDTATTEIYTLSLHDALPICDGGERRDVLGQQRRGHQGHQRGQRDADPPARAQQDREQGDRKSTRLNSSHLVISYAVFCLKKKTTG